MTTDNTQSELAQIFHDTYERLAPEFGYETREETKQFDPESPNGKLMIAVCGEFLDWHNKQVQGVLDRLEPLVADNPKNVYKTTYRQHLMLEAIEAERNKLKESR